MSGLGLKAMPLVIENVTADYPNGKVAVSQVSLTVAPGEIFGLVGPNGAGKSSLLKCAAGLLVPRSGRVLCGGRDVTGVAARSAVCISVMLDPLGVYNDLTAWQYLEFFARAHGLPADARARRVAEIVDQLGLGPWLDQEVEALSAGWQRRLALGRLLLTEAPILLLDEPAAGLDIAARSSLLERVRAIASEGRTIVVTSHILSELEQLADRFGILRDGRWVPMGPGKLFFTRADISTGLGSKRWRLEALNPQKATELLTAWQVPFSVERDSVRVALSNAAEASDLLAKLVGAGVRVSVYVPEEMGLSDLTKQVLQQEETS